MQERIRRKGLIGLRILPSLDQIEFDESQREHFAPGIGFCKLFWVFLFAGAFGVLLETSYCFWRTGFIESRATFVWLPLNMVYGVAGVIMTVVLYCLRKFSRVGVFFVGMFLGCVIEFLCSLVQEHVFQSISWRYSGPTNILGRTSLKYALVWGLLALMWMKVIYPLISMALLKIPRKAGRVITAVLVLILLLNMVVTFLAVQRWAVRSSEPDTEVRIYQWVDAWFPDSRMEQLFPNLRFTGIGESTS
ncbi:MAG: putative ABC transporter permease [Clostridiaceae bacterium]|nr:putative ABC transporter permease [Clostridiaceae bacterium]